MYKLDRLIRDAMDSRTYMRRGPWAVDVTYDFCVLVMWANDSRYNLLYRYSSTGNITFSMLGFSDAAVARRLNACLPGVLSKTRRGLQYTDTYGRIYVIDADAYYCIKDDDLYEDHNGCLLAVRPSNYIEWAKDNELEEYFNYRKGE